MTEQRLTSDVGPPWRVVPESPQRRTVGSYTDELRKILQREARAQEEAHVREEALLHQMDQLIQEQEEVLRRLFAWREDAANRIASLTPRQREIMDLVLAGHPNKNIAADLGLSSRTIESHRAVIMKKTGSKSLPALARLALAAALNDVPEMQSATNNLPGGKP